MHYKDFLFFILFTMFLSGCMNVGSYYVVNTSNKESFDIIANDDIIMGCGGIIVGDTLIFSIDSKLLNKVKSEKLQILGIDFTLNNLTSNEKDLQKTIYSLGYSERFESLNSVSALDSIMSAGNPVSFVYAIHKGKVSHLESLNVKVQVLMKMNGNIKTFKASCIMKRKTRYKIIPT